MLKNVSLNVGEDGLAIDKLKQKGTLE